MSVVECHEICYKVTVEHSPNRIMRLRAIPLRTLQRYPARRVLGQIVIPPQNRLDNMILLPTREVPCISIVEQQKFDRLS